VENAEDTEMPVILKLFSMLIQIQIQQIVLCAQNVPYPVRAQNYPVQLSKQLCFERS
jgi:hypothetical protein